MRLAQRAPGSCFQLHEEWLPLGERGGGDVLEVTARGGETGPEGAGRGRGGESITRRDRAVERRQLRARLARGAVEERERIGRGVSGRGVLDQGVLANRGAASGLARNFLPRDVVVERRSPRMLLAPEPAVVAVTLHGRAFSVTPRSGFWGQGEECQAGTCAPIGEAPGCGCATNSGRGAAGSLVLLFATAFALRRRRSRR